MLTVYAAKKSKSVCLLSTKHQTVEIEETQKQKPNTVTDYELLKGGLDIIDPKLGTESAGWPGGVLPNIQAVLLPKKTEKPAKAKYQAVEIEETQKQKPNTVTDYELLKGGLDIIDPKLGRWPGGVLPNIQAVLLPKKTEKPAKAK
ncbi:unnamed protein product [Menidia menidia]|uniref:(Atlantic silverside) hypothetical protein n=1 Tax=Menidia menidia TaxID=238744 RepID=A0A8S4B2A4_9TELE|nr:unnamed protein product [Menidia menidia]